MDMNSQIARDKEYEFPTYIVEELNVCGSEAQEWETTRVRFGQDKSDFLIKAYLGPKKHIVLPAYINGEKVAGIDSSGLRDCQAEIIEIPGSYEELRWDYGLSNDKHLKKIVIGEGIKKMEACFKQISTLQEALVSQSVEIVDRFAFSDTPWRKEQEKKDFFIVGRALVRYSGDESTVYVPEGVRSICYEAIWSDKVRKVVLPQTLTTICREAFGQPSNKSITEFVFPDSLKEIGADAFKWTKWLENFGGDPVVINDILYRCDAKEKAVTIPQGVAHINEDAFRENENIEEIYCPDSLKSIGPNAFKFCKNIKKIVLGNSIENIEKNAFFKCEALETVEMGVDELKTIGDAAFAGCRSLKENAAAAVIGQNAFSDCAALEEAIMAPNMEKIPAQVFGDCTGLQRVHVPDGVKIIEREAFYKCKNLREVTLPRGLEEIYSSAFEDCVSLEIVKMPGVDSNIGEYVNIGTNAFRNTPYVRKANGEFEIYKGALKKYLGNEVDLKIPDNVTEICNCAFGDSPQIESLIIPDSVTRIGESLFAPKPGSFAPRTVKLKKVVIGDGVTSIGANAFEGCEKLREVVFGKALSEIKPGAFFRCIKLKDVVFGESLSIIGYGAFRWCKFKKIDLSNTSVTEIPNEAFLGCKEVKSVLLPDKLVSIGWSAFSDINLKKVELPASVRQIGRDAFNAAEEVIIPDTIGTFIDAIGADRRSKYSYITRNAGADGCAVTVYSAASGEVKYKIFCAGEEDNEYYKMLSEACKEGSPFNFKLYDEYFPKPGDPLGKARTAMCRLECPCELMPEHRESYEAYLQRFMYIESSAKRIFRMIAEKDDVEDLEFLKNYGALSERSLPWAEETFAEYKAKKCLKFIKRKA